MRVFIIIKKVRSDVIKLYKTNLIKFKIAENNNYKKYKPYSIIFFVEENISAVAHMINIVFSAIPSIEEGMS